MAVLGHGKEHFDFKSSMVSTGEPFSTPLYKIGVLLEELRLVNNERPDKPLDKVIIKMNICSVWSLFAYLQEYVMVKELYEKYQEMAARISSQMCQYRLSKVRS